MRWSTPSVPVSTRASVMMKAREYAIGIRHTPSTDGSSRAGAGRNKSTRDAGQRRGWSQTDGSAGEAPPPPRKPIGALTRDAKKDEQEDRDTIVACGAARRRRQRRPDVVLDSTPRRVAPPPDGTLRVAGAPQKLLPAPPPPPEALLDGFESDEAVEDSRTGGGGWGRGFL